MVGWLCSPDEVLSTIGKALNIRCRSRDHQEKSENHCGPANSDLSQGQKSSGISAEVSESLIRALSSGDIDEVMELISVIERENYDLAQKLKALADEYNYDAILAKIQISQ